MATEEEAREAADKKEVQVEAVDLEPVHMQTNLDGKLSSMEVKDVGEIIDSTEGKLKIPEDYVLVEAPSEIKLPTEHSLNGTASSLNGHMDEEDEISNEKQHEDNRKDEKQVEAPLDGESTYQSSKINQEVNDSLNHGETTTEDSSLLKHEKEEEPRGDDQQDEDLMQEDKLKTDSDVGHLDQILDPAKATEDKQPSSLANIPDVEVVAEAPAGVQTPVDPSLDDSDAIPDTIDGSTETDEPAKENSDIHLDHRESFPEDTSIAEHIEEVVKIKVEDQQSTQADAMDADVEPEEMPKSEHADESTIEAQEVLNQEPSEETNGPEQDSIKTNSTETTVVKMAPSSKDDKVEDDVTEAGSTSGSQEVDNVGSTEEITEIIAENIVEVSNVAIVDEENKEKNMLRNEDIAEKHVRGIESEDTKNLEHVETDEDSDQRHVSLLDDSAQEDNTPACEKQQMESASEINETEATRNEAVPEESNVSISEEPSPEEYVTENETTRDTKEVNITESLEEMEGDKDTKTREISNQSNMDSAGKLTQENNVPESEPTSDVQLEQELESEEMKDTELLQVNESSHEINAAVFHKQTQENNPTASELHVMESAGGVSNIEATEVEATPHQFNDDHSEEKVTEETITSTNPQTLEPESVENMNDIVATDPQSISQQSISPFEKSVPEEVAKEDNVTMEQDDGHQQPQDLELAELNEIETWKSQEIASSSIVSNSEEPILEDNATVTEPSPETQAENLPSAGVIKDDDYLKSHGALASETAQEENVETEALVDTSPVQEPELEEAKKTEPVGTEDSITPSDLPEETMDRETVDTEAIPQESLVESTIEVTEKDALTAISPHSDIQPVQEQESVEDAHTDTTEKPSEAQQIVGSASDELTPTEENTTIAEPACDTPVQNVTAHEIKNSEDAQTDQFYNLDSCPTPGETAQESKLSRIEPTSDVQEMQELGSTEESRVMEAAGTEDRQEHRVSTLEPAVDNEPNVDDQQAQQDKPAELRDNEAMEAAEEVSEQSNIDTPEYAPEERSELGNDPDCCVQPAQQVESSRDSEDNTLLKAEEMSDQKVVILEDTPGEAAKQSILSRIEPTSDVQEMQEVSSTEESRVIEAAETEDHQEHRVSTFEEPAVDNEPNVDDQQVHQDKPAEIRDNEAMEAEEVSEQTSIDSPETAPEEMSEVGNDPDCCVQPAQQVESSRDSEDNTLLKAEDMSDQKVVTLEDTIIEDSVADEIDPSVGEKEHALESVEEIKDISVNEDKGDFHTSQPDALDKLASEGNITTTEATSDIQQLNDFETKEMNSIEGSNDGYISCEQTKTATSVDPSPTDNELASGEHPVEPHDDNLGNETDNAMVAHGMKDETQTSVELKDDTFDFGETVPTTKKSNNTTDEDAIQSSGEDKLESSNSNDHIKEEQKIGTEIGTAEASQTVIGDDTQGSQIVMEKDDTIKSDEQTSDKRQSDGIEHQLQTCESSVEDEAVQKVSLDEQHKEDEEVESKKEQLQADEQKHEDTRDDVTIEPLVESKNIENGTTNRTEEIETFEAEQTEAVVNEIVKNEQALQTSEESTPSITVTTDDYVGTDKGAEEENRPNSANTSDADAKVDNQEEQENTETGNIGATNSTNEQDETTNEDPIAVTHNVESREHGVDKECINKIHDDVLAIQKSEKAIVAEVREMQNEDKAVHQAESQIKAEEEETSQLYSNEPSNVDNKIDDKTQIADLIQGTATIQPREIEERGENKGISSISKPVVETPEQNNVEKDLSIHQKVEDEKLESTEDNAIELESTQQKVDTSNADTSNDDQLPISNSLAKHETESADDVLQLEIEGNASDKVDEAVSYGKTEASNTSAPETVTFNKEMHDKATEAERGLSDESFKTFDDTGRNLDVSSVVTDLHNGSMDEKIEEHKLDLPAHPTQDENTHEQDMTLSENPLPTEPEEQEEENMHEPNFGDDKKEVEQDLPVSHFLMNLILGKENTDSNGHSEPEAETKQEETRDDNSSLIIPKQEESLPSLPVESRVEYKFPVEQEKKDAKCSEETHEVAEEQIQDLKLGIETSSETDAEFNKSSHNLELPTYQDNMKDEISNELLSEEAVEVVTKMEAKDIEISNIEQNGGKFDTICQENTMATTEIENGSLKKNLDDLTNTKASEENTRGEGQTELLPECLNDDRSADAVPEQTLPLTESGTDAKSSPTEAASVQNPVCEIHDKIIEATSTPVIQVKSEEDKAEEKQPATTATGEVAEECVEVSNDNPQNNIVPEATSNEREPLMAEQVSDTEIALVHEKQISEGSRSIFMDEKEGSNVSVQELDNIQPAEEIQADGSNMQISQDKQEAADNQTEMEPEKLEESNIQEIQENGTEQKSPKECYNEGQKLLVKEEALIKEADVHETAESHAETAVETQADGSDMQMTQDKQEAADNQTEMEPGRLEESNIQEIQKNGTEQKSPKEETLIKEAETVKIKSNEEQELSGSKIQERDLNVFSHKEAPKAAESFMGIGKPEFGTDEKQSPMAAESFVDTAKPKFSTDEEQSPKADEVDMSEQKTYEEKTKDEDETKNFTDEAMETEARGAAQKAAHKKQNLLSGLKHQLAKVKKVITGKPGHKKPESPKS